MSQVLAKALRALRSAQVRLRSRVLLGWYRALYPGFHAGKGVRLGRGVHMIVTNGASLTIGDDVLIERHCELIVDGTMTIGPGTFVGTGSILAAAERLDIGRDGLIAPYVMIRDNDHRVERSNAPYCQQGLVSSPVKVGNNVWIGTKATVLRGVTIGDGAIVGANALVSSDVEAGSLVAGVPARLIKRLRA